MSSTASNLGCLLLFLAFWFSSLSAAPPTKYEIQGVAVSSRNGAPIPFCRLSAEPAPSSTPVPQRNSGLPSSLSGRAGSRQHPGTASRLAPNPPAREGKSEAVADASGRFTIEVPQAGSWHLLGVAPGFHSQAFEEHSGFYTAIVLTPDEPSFHATFRLSAYAMITGRVLDEAGDAVRTAQVAVERVPSQLPGESHAAADSQMRQVEVANTDDRGRYELSGLTPGQYRVRVQAQPWYASDQRFQPSPASSAAAASPPKDLSLDVVYATTWFPAADNEAQAETLVLSSGEERQADFHLTPLPAVHLQIPRETSPGVEPGRSRPQRMTTINRISPDGLGPFSNLTSSSGGGSGWEFSGLAPGTYEVHLPGPDGRAEGETRQIQVRSGTTGNITLEGSVPLTRVAIHIDGVPENEVSAVDFVDTNTGRHIVWVPAAEHLGRRRGGDEDHGEKEGPPAAVVMLPPQTYDVVVAARSDLYLSTISATGAGVAGTRITIEGASPVLTLHVARGRGTLSGFARRKGKDSPAQGAQVLLVPITLGTPGNTLPVLRDQANSDGSFILTAIIPGKYILLAIDGGWEANWKDPQSLAPYLLRGLALEIRPESKSTETISAQIP